MQPAISKCFGRSCCVFPITRHDHVASNANFADLSNRSWLIVSVSHHNLYICKGSTYRGDMSFVIWMTYGSYIWPGKTGDGHWAFALPINLDKDVAKHGFSSFTVLNIHWPTAIDDRFPVTAIGCGNSGMFNKAFYHRGGSKHCCFGCFWKKFKYFWWIKLTTLRHYLGTHSSNKRQPVKPSSMRHWCGMKPVLALSWNINIWKICEGTA